MTVPTDVVDRQLAAFNARDINSFVTCYAEGAAVLQPDGSVLASGHDEIRRQYGELFDRSPDLRAVIPNRIAVGPVVVDEELITGFNLPGAPSEMHSVVAYRVNDDLIDHARILA
jgi:hypothetical protein